MISKFSGKCSKCSNRYNVGDSITYVPSAPRGARGICATCQPVRGRGRPVGSYKNRSYTPPYTAPYTPPPYVPPTPREPLPPMPAGGVYLAHFNSCDEFLKTGNNPSEKNLEARNTRLTDRRGGGSTAWLGHSFAPEILHGAVWSEGVRKIEEAMESVTVPTPQTARWRSRWNDAGDEPDAERLRFRSDRAWLDMERPQVFGKKIVNILICTSVGSSVSAEEFFWRGAAVTRLVNALTEAGYGVGVTAVYHTENPFVEGPTIGIVTVRLKSHDEPLDVERIAAWTALPASNRWARFAHYESLGWKVSGGRGHTHSAQRAIERAPDHFQSIGLDVEKAIIIDKHVDNKWSANSAVRQALEKLEA